MADSLKTKTIAKTVHAAAAAAAETIIAKLATLADQEKTTQADLHKLIGKVRTEPVMKKVSVTTKGEDGTETVTETEEPTNETREIVERWDLVKVILAAVEEANPGAFVVETQGRLAGLYRGSKPAPVAKADLTPEQKAAARDASKAKKSEEMKADAMKAALELLKAQGVAVPDNLLGAMPKS